EIGLYRPKEEPSFITITSDRAQYWLGVGAQPSEAVAKLLKITGDWQTFRGISGTEGTLKVAEPKRSKQDIFNEALKDAANEPKGAAVTKKAAAKKAEKPEKPEKKVEEAPAEKTEEAPAAEAPAAEVVEAPAAEAAKAPAEDAPAAVETPAETAEAAETDAEPSA
ncbi:MAG: 30S ribosomal protein S16, partial [Nocardioides sp.]